MLDAETLFRWRWIALLLPAVATFLYPRLHFSADLPDGCRYAVAPALYGLAVAAAATFYEFRLLRRLLRCLVVGFVASSLSTSFDVILIITVAVISGIVAVGVAPDPIWHMSSRFLARLAAETAYRVLRASVGLAVTVAALFACALVPSLGTDPAAGGDITGGFGRFTFVTYAMISALVLFDRKASEG